VGVAAGRRARLWWPSFCRDFARQLAEPSLWASFGAHEPKSSLQVTFGREGAMNNNLVASRGADAGGWHAMGR